MNARFYVGANGRFASADTIIPNPGSSQGFNRYAYSYNNPINFYDPTGHFTVEAIEEHINHLCETTYGGASCFEDTLSEWQNNDIWWSLLLQAEAGDDFFTIDGNYYEFVGEGVDYLGGYWGLETLGTDSNRTDGGGLNLIFPFTDRIAALIKWENEFPHFSSSRLYRQDPKIVDDSWGYNFGFQASFAYVGSWIGSKIPVPLSKASPFIGGALNIIVTEKGYRDFMMVESGDAHITYRGQGTNYTVYFQQQPSNAAGWEHSPGPGEHIRNFFVSLFSK